MSTEIAGFRPYLRDGVDVYLAEGQLTIFVFLATRRRLQVAVESWLVACLPLLDGTQTLGQLIDDQWPTWDEPTRQREKFIGFVEYLVDRSIVVDADWQGALDFPTPYVRRITRQLDYLLDTCAGVAAVEVAQRKVYDCVVGIVGLGGVGSWLTQLLPMVGFRQYVLIDGSDMAANGRARDLNFSDAAIGQPRVDLAADRILRIDPEAQVARHRAVITPESDLTSLLGGVDVVVNTADEPYIGYVNLLLSRFAVRHSKVLLAGGGFNAHLGSFGELIVPGSTPCADCYTSHFKRELKGWKPIEHPVTHRSEGAGGLASLAAFAASQGVLILLNHLWGTARVSDARSEFIFDDYRVDRIPVPRDPNCKWCSGLW